VKKKTVLSIFSEERRRRGTCLWIKILSWEYSNRKQNDLVLNRRVYPTKLIPPSRVLTKKVTAAHLVSKNILVHAMESKGSLPNTGICPEPY
jgi:hypothetical protein